MAKNTWQLEYARELARCQKQMLEAREEYAEKLKNNEELHRERLERNIEALHCGLAIALDRRGWSDDEFNQVLVEINDIWNEVAESDMDMAEYCYKETGYQFCENGKKPLYNFEDDADE